MTGPGWLLRRARWRQDRHLSEDRLLALALSAADRSTQRARTGASHLETCEGCKSRFEALTTLLEALPEAADAGFEEVFPPQRLQAQRKRIEHRLAQLVGSVAPARVLAFPFSGRALRRLSFRSARWLAATTAAGVLLGIAAGQFIHLHPVESPSTTSADTAGETVPLVAMAGGAPAGSLDMTGTVALPPPYTGSQPAAELTLVEFAQLMTEEGFLSALDLALTRHQISELESIDALTPRVSDLATSIR